MTSVTSAEAYVPLYVKLVDAKIKLLIGTGKGRMNLVQIKPSATIPLHVVESPVEMYVVAGSGWVSCIDAANGRHLSPGYRIVFDPDKPYGFRASEEGLTLLSFEEFVDKNSKKWGFSVEVET